MENELKYPIGVQSFVSIRTEGYVYIDKTQYIRDLLKNKYYFLSRPRRFGKSLFLSTLEAYFRGRRELFEGLAVSEWEKDWTVYPVIRVDFAAMNGTDPKGLMESLLHSLSETAKSYGLDVSDPVWQGGEYRIGDIFSTLIKQLVAKYSRKAVILIDEYDKGLIETIDDDEQLSRATNLLQPFFSVLESQDENIRFAFLTGVSRFRNTTIFSGANNLRDISLNESFAAICGITQNELVKNLDTQVRAMAQKFGMDVPRMYDMLRNRYDGYRFSAREEYVYNPFSLLNALNDKDLRDYWVMSGSSKVLAHFMKGSELSLEDLTSRTVSANMLEMKYSRENPLSLFYQTGYLTIAESRGMGNYRLRIPNQEVQTMLTELLIPLYVTGYDEQSV